MKSNIFCINKVLKALNTVLYLLDYCIVFFVFITIGSAWVYDANLSVSVDDLYGLLQKLVVLYIIIASVCIKKIHKGNTFLTVYVLGCLLLYSQLNPYLNEHFIVRYLILIPLMVVWLLFHEDKSSVWKCFINISVAVAVVSLIYYVFASVLRIIPETYSVDRMFGGWKPDQIKNFQYLYYESHLLRVAGLTFWRNTSFFCEAPKYTINLCMALGAELLLMKDQKRWKIIVLIVTILSTLSTRGPMYIVLAGAFFVFINPTKFPKLKSSTEFIKKNPVKIIAILCAIMIAFFLSKFLSPNGRGSLSTRSDHIIACMKTFARCSMYGCGYHNIGFIWQYANQHQGIAAGIPYFMAWGGILMSSVIAVPVIHDGYNSVKRHQFGKFLFEISILFLWFFGMPEPGVQFFVAWMISESILNNAIGYRIDNIDTRGNGIIEIVVMALAFVVSGLMVHSVNI